MGKVLDASSIIAMSIFFCKSCPFWLVLLMVMLFQEQSAVDDEIAALQREMDLPLDELMPAEYVEDVLQAGDQAEEGSGDESFLSSEESDESSSESSSVYSPSSNGSSMTSSPVTSTESEDDSESAEEGSPRFRRRVSTKSLLEEDKGGTVVCFIVKVFGGGSAWRTFGGFCQTTDLLNGFWCNGEMCRQCDWLHLCWISFNFLFFQLAWTGSLRRRSSQMMKGRSPKKRNSRWGTDFFHLSFCLARKGSPCPLQGSFSQGACQCELL